ncbi:HYR domain-containing protein, partial [Christiangramia aquimixticola]
AISYSVGGSNISFPYNFPIGTTTVTVTADDGDSNSANTTCTFDVTVIDDEAPVITNCPAPVNPYSVDAGE